MTTWIKDNENPSLWAVMKREESNYDTSNSCINLCIGWLEGSHRVDSQSGQVARPYWRQEISDYMADDLPF